MGMAFLMIPFIILDLIFFASKCGHLSATVFQCMAFFLVCVIPSYPTIPPRFISSILSLLTYSWSSQSGLIVSHVCFHRAQHIHRILTCHFTLVSFQFGFMFIPHLILNKRFLVFLIWGIFQEEDCVHVISFSPVPHNMLVFMWPMQSRLSTWVKLDR